MNDVNFIKFCVCVVISFAVSLLIALMSDKKQTSQDAIPLGWHLEV